MNGKTSTFAPAENVGDANARLRLAYFDVNVSDLAKPNATFNVAANLRFSGAQRLAVLAYGKSTHLAAEGDRPSPGFDGGFLPVKRTISAQGFTAEWSIPFIARGIPAEGTSTAVSALDRTALGISFVEVADPYQSVSRALKYSLLFVGLLFLSYFVFEATAGKRVHPAQYVLVGVAQMIFYLLLLSFAERIGFDWAFLVAGGATVLLLSANAEWIFASRVQGLRALFVFSLLYFFIYLLLRLEDNALLVGAVASFLAVAAVMYFTRNIDWYSSIPAGGARPTGAVERMRCRRPVSAGVSQPLSEIYFDREIHSDRRTVLIAVVGVDVEAEDGVYFNRLHTAHGGAELPGGQGSHDFRGHGGGAGFEDLEIFQVAGSVEFAFDDDAGVGKVRGQVGAQALWSDERSGERMRGGIDFGELHHYSADRRIEIDGVVVAGELAVEIKRSAGTRRGDDGDCRPLVLLY